MSEHDAPEPPADGGTADRAGLTAAEQELWRAFLGWSEQVTAGVAKALATAGLSVPEFEILARLHAAPGRRLGQLDLGLALGWSASRLSHQLSRMAARDLLDRAEAGTGRAMDVALTGHGAQVIGSALQVHARAVRERFLDPLDAESRHTLGRVFTGRSRD
ncbi:MarR family winged helix-turn-helix transcriptional regulator [Streptomyces sp. NPDC007088]|uniref:MarR family winged helix-turn-helix transcriptional regulator n=1 Tax=Streptomyces sp. NPDC007088 TaxID=3364773 RepID=UPI00367C4029